MAGQDKISVVIPAYNEAESIRDIVTEIRGLDGADKWEVIVVNDGSTDDTENAAREAGALVISHKYNLGNGASVKRGILASTGDVVVFMDADGQHPPSEIPNLLAHIDEYDMVVAARTRDSKVSRFRSIGNFALIQIAQFLSGHKIDDLTSGFRAMKADKLKEFVHLFPRRYSYPTTITLSMLSAGYFVLYVPMKSIKARAAGKSNIKPFQDGIRFINIMMRIIMLFNPQKVFLPIAAFFFISGTVLGVYDAFTKYRVEESTLLALLFGLFIFLFGMLADQVAHIRRELHTFLSKPEDD